MTGEPRVALDRLIAAFETHLAAVTARRGDQDPVVESAYGKLADAFESYDKALLKIHDETTPFVLYDEDEFDDYDDLDEDFDDEEDTEFIDLGDVPAEGEDRSGAQSTA